MNDRSLTPTNYQPPGREPRATPNSSVTPSAVPFVWWRSQLVLMMIAFALLLLGGLLLSWLLPPAALSNTPSAVSVAPNGNSSFVPNAEGDTELAPWQAQQRADARAQAQQILAELIELKRNLESMRVREWRLAEFDAALARAEQGDDHYALQAFSQALAEYQAAHSALQSLERQIPQVVEQYTNNANKAMNDGRFELAEQYFSKALQLDRNHIPALSGQARLATMPEVLSTIASADDKRQQYHSRREIDLLESALADYQKALETDALAPGVSDKMQATERQITEHRFNAAMSSALGALLAGRYAVAQTQFSLALDERPEHKLAKQGLDQALALNKGSSIREMFAQASALESKENWQQAASVYSAILARDSSQVKARGALVQAQVRAQLDAKLRAALAEPMHVTDPERRDAITQTLAQAKGIRRQGAVLDGQIEALEALLEGATQIVTLSLTSDSATTVYLLKRGAKPIKYAPFANKVLSLPPGRYALSGQRVGYQDVRQELVIAPNTERSLRVDIRSKVALAAPLNAGEDS